MAPFPIIVACGIFRDELRAVLADRSAEILWLDPLLHIDQDKMFSDISHIVTGGDCSRDVRLFVGNACHPKMDTLAHGCGCCTAPFKNCIEAFTGEQRQRELEAGRTMLITPGWVRAWLGRRTNTGWDAAEMRLQHGRYDRILLLEPGINPVEEEEILQLFDLIRVPIEIAPLELDHFKKTVQAIIKQKRS